MWSGDFFMNGLAVLAVAVVGFLVIVDAFSGGGGPPIDPMGEEWA